MEEKETRLKVEDRYVQSRVYTDTFVGGRWRLNMEDNAGAAVPPEKCLDEYRRKPRVVRQTEEQRKFWAEFAKGF